MSRFNQVTAQPQLGSWRRFNPVTGEVLLGFPWETPRNPLWDIAGQVPTFHLDFTSGQVRELISNRTGTFTRPSSVKLAWNGSQFVEFPADVPALQRDPATGLWGYLHEPAATNLFLNSGAPATQTIAVTAQQYTLSFYGTGTITLSGASAAGPLVGTGAEPNRVSLTFTPSAGNLTLTLSGSISKPQLETGPVATSPITTAGSSVTRAADVWTWTEAQFSDWCSNSGEGVWVAGAVPYFDVSTIGSGRLIAATNSVAMMIGMGTSNRVETWTGTGGGANILATNYGWTARARMRAATAHTPSGRSIVLNGGAVISNAIVMPAVANGMRLGASNNGTSPFNGLILEALYFPPGPAADRIQALSAL